MEGSVAAALVGATTGSLVTVIGWSVNYRLSRKKEEASRKNQAKLTYIQKQIEELYGPLFGLIQNAQFVREVATGTLPSSPEGYILFEQFDDTKGDTQAWRYFVEGHFLPLIDRMSNLIYKNLHLLESGEIPESFQHFFRHKAHFDCLDRLWREKGIRNESYQSEGWPVQFGEDVQRTLDQLIARYHDYLQSAEEI
jgi:hypothetical protein